MPQRVIKFTGINRRKNEFQCSGECDELINLRPIASGLEVVKPKKKSLTGVSYDIHNHLFGDESHLIGVETGTTFRIYDIDSSGGTTLIDSFDIDESVWLDSPEYSIAFLGNQILFSKHNVFRAYAYKDGRYRRIKAEVPADLDIRYTISEGSGYSEEYVAQKISDSEFDETYSALTLGTNFKDSVMNNWSAAVGKNAVASETFGPVLVAFNFELSDGTEFWTNKWIYVNPYLISSNADKGGKHMVFETIPYILTDWAGYMGYIKFKSYGITFTIAQTDISTSSDNLVKYVNVYASRPIFPFSMDSMTSSIESDNRARTYASAQGLDTSGITKQLLYFQKSIPVSDIDKGNVTFTLDFSDTQTGERVLEVDNGPVERVGQMTAYNSRVHVYDSRTIVSPQSIVCASGTGEEFEERPAYVYIFSGEDTLILETTALVPVSTSSTTKLYCCYPDARATKIRIGNGGTSTYFTEISLTPSSRYNYAYGQALYPMVNTSAPTPTDNVLKEPDTINVSEQYNPFVFPVEHSYRIGGQIMDLATAYMPISSTQIGQYPLTVFTSSGIFAMEQGSGTALYGNILPLQPLVINGKACSTPHGIFFISSGSLYLMSGRELMNVSHDIKAKSNHLLCRAHEKLCCDTTGSMFNFLPLMDNATYSNDFFNDAKLTYDLMHNELYISHSPDEFAYVFNLNTKMFHKIGMWFRRSLNGARYVVAGSGDTTALLDLHEEEVGEQPVLLQSRPMALDAMMTHIHRLVLLTDTNLEDDQNLSLSVFGSDNLYDWKCIISAQKYKTVLRQIRTNRAAKSYRDYVIVINGTVSTDTDISDLIADYTAVNRRLG